MSAIRKQPKFVLKNNDQSNSNLTTFPIKNLRRIRVLTRHSSTRQGYYLTLHHNCSKTQATCPKLELHGQYRGKYINFKITHITLKLPIHTQVIGELASFWCIAIAGRVIRPSLNLRSIFPSIHQDVKRIYPNSLHTASF